MHTRLQRSVAAAPNVHGFVTNSHCTEERSAVTGTLFNQKQLALPTEPIGTEVWDLAFFSCQYPGFLCRWSDASGILYMPGVENTHGLHKTGRTTGWTMGPVVATCLDVGVAGVAEPIAMLCQDIVESLAAGGDSGSPVFERIGDT